MRLQLSRRVRPVGAAVVLLFASKAHAQKAEPAPSNLTTRASAEVSGYLDSVSTTVLTQP